MTTTSTFVQAQANVVTVTNLTEGDVYKRLHKESYSPDHKLYFGVVTSILHNGEDAVITALEFDAAYNTVEPKIKVFGTDTELKIFTANPEEIEIHLNEVHKMASKLVSDKTVELTKAEQVVAQIERVRDRSDAKVLTAPATQAVEA